MLMLANIVNKPAFVEIRDLNNGAMDLDFLLAPATSLAMMTFV